MKNKENGKLTKLDANFKSFEIFITIINTQQPYITCTLFRFWVQNANQKKKQTNKQKTRKGDQTLYAHSKFTFSSWQTSNILVILSGSQLTESTNPRNTKLGLTRQRWWIIPLPMPFLTILGKTVNETSYWRRLYAVWNNTHKIY